MDKKEISELITYTKSLKILYVEDNDQARTQTIKMLENFFTDIIFAVDGRDGLEKYSQEKPDLVLTDINMPNMNGLEMLSKIREEDEHIPLIIITAHDETNLLLKSIDLNVDNYLLKPVKIDQFINILNKVAYKLRAFDENIKYRKEIEELNTSLEKKVEKKTKLLKDKLYLDELTKVGSRYALVESLNQMEDKEYGLLLSLKIDSFSIYNDLYTNEIGNIVLIEFAKALSIFASQVNFKVFRSHGDNFLLFSKIKSCNNSSLSSYISEFELFLKEYTVFIDEINESITFSSTLGAACGNKNLMANANIALTYARKNLKKHFIYDSKTDNKEHLKNILYWKNELQNAIKEDRIEPVFQPIYDRNYNIIKYESLIRIKQISQDDETTIITPNKFLDIAKTTKVYNKLSYITIEKTINTAIEKQVSVSINLTIMDIQNKQFLTMLHRKIEQFVNKRKKDNLNIIIEILEDESIKDYENVKKVLYEFKKLGALIAIDDFGSGYSNLKHILELSPDYIKIDGSLIKEIDKDIKSRELVRAIILFAKATNVKTIAEFISDKKIFDIVFKLGIDEFQGYYLSKPKLREEI